MTLMHKYPEDDIAMVKGNNWPYPHVLCMKKSLSNGDYEHGCIVRSDRSVIFKTNVWDWNPNTEKIKYNSVEAMVDDGWMVD